VYVAGQRSGRVYAVDAASGIVKRSTPICSEPVGIVVDAHGHSVYVACSQDASVVRLDATTLAGTATTPVHDEPWALAWSPDGATIFASHFLGAQLTPIAANTMAAGAPLVVPEVAARGDRRLAHGKPRGLYDLAVRPGTRELWITNVLLGTDTPQPQLDFESTAFATLTVLSSTGALERTLSTAAPNVPGDINAFSDTVSGPHAIAFTRDGGYALVVDTSSEDVLVVDAETGVESSILRPLPGHQPEGIVLSPDETTAYVSERNTSDVVVLDVHRSADWLTLSVAGPVIPTTAHDPMPTTLRLGQHIFNSANSDEYPVTKNHWIACATCHFEGRSDAVTWLFEQGPRDTPSNAAGMLGTGFLFRTADRARVQDYWRTINVEQGGQFDPKNRQHADLLDALAAYVNLAIPAPVPPTTDPKLVVRGAAVFRDTGCGSCHSGPRFTDSGAGNTNLDLAGPIVLHDVGTCVTDGKAPDAAHEDLAGHARAACMFDTPSLTGIASTPPYLHDGSAATLADCARIMVANTGHAPLSASDLGALVEYLKSL
jgi:sugar lactone lactonase YvrE